MSSVSSFSVEEKSHRHEDAGFVAVGTHYINGTKDGEQIKVVSAQNHTLYDTTTGAYDVAVLTLEKASKFKPVRLPAADGSDITPNMWATVMGWGDTSYPNGTTSDILLSVQLPLWENVDCVPLFNIDETMVCAGGVADKDSCIGDTGGPLIKEKGKGDADDILIGLVSWGSGCGQQSVPAVYSLVSAAMEWIESVIKK
ncbi:unnamed protein product [Phytophthora lilii]|uniref:Unnamed protein product n=1 Tax=Phytophthora lilii TaxID=2077276 RepID=A0A9W6TJR0_9STRA|nr:unnamed protein product [Phytophthora lilii]